MIEKKERGFYNTTSKNKWKKKNKWKNRQRRKLTRIEKQNVKIGRLGKHYRKKTNYYKLRPRFKKIVKFLNNKENIKYNINIKITPNNIFCTLRKNKTNQTILLISAGILKLKISKKKLKYVNKILVQNFIDKIKKKVRNTYCILKISGPKKIIKFVTRQLIFFLKKTKLLVNNLSKKIFNGCRAKKIRRKKHKGMRFFK